MPTFPTSPTKGQKFTVGTNEYRWSGSVWLLVHKQMPLGATGSLGPTGATGASVTYETGAIHLYAGGTSLPGSSGEWLWCDGSTLNAATNTSFQALYNVIGIGYGGTGNTNFVLPNLCTPVTSLSLSGLTAGTGVQRLARGRATTSTAVETSVPVGWSATREGAFVTGVESSHTHTNNADSVTAVSAANNANHSHGRNGGIGAHTHYFGYGGSGSANLAYGAAANYAGFASAGHTHTGGAGVSGGNTDTYAAGSNWYHNHTSNTSLTRAASSGAKDYSFFTSGGWHYTNYGWRKFWFIIKT
jgi:microcystin-dependent protein